MTNHGSLPGNIPARIDMKLACGWVVKDRDPRKFRWSLTGSPGDIAEWRETKP